MKRISIILTLLICFAACKNKPKNEEIVVKFVQVNDVYEIAPLSGGKFGGMARVAHVRDSIKKENPNTFLFMAGDFLNPSLLGTLKLDGERIYGKQMIEVMNIMEFDLVTFGNHEFDISEADLQKRLNESTFNWMTSNTKHNKGENSQAFAIEKENDTLFIPETHVFTIEENNQKLQIGFLGVTLPSNPKDYVYYGDIYDDAKKAYTSLMGETDIVIGLTHVEVGQDKKILEQIPEIPLIMGGHEHNAMLVDVNGSKIAKADANAKTVYVHTLTYNIETKEYTIDSELVFIDDTVASQPKVEAVVNKWMSILDLKIKEVIDDPNEIIYIADTPLDGTDSASRSIQTNLGDLITESMAWAYDGEVDAALVNGGSIRIDDMLPAEITSMDVFRVLPFGGGVLKVSLKGSLVKEVLEYGKSKRGSGAYLQRHNISQDKNGEWTIGGNPIDNKKIYHIAFSDFLLKGYDIPFLTPDNPDVVKVYETPKDSPAFDIRKAIILYVKTLNNK